VDKEEARQIGEKVLAEYRALPYSELAGRVNKAVGHEVAVESGVSYYYDIVIAWNRKNDGDIKVGVRVEDLHSTSDWVKMYFIISPDGSITDKEKEYPASFWEWLKRLIMR